MSVDNNSKPTIRVQHTGSRDSDDGGHHHSQPEQQQQQQQQLASLKVSFGGKKRNTDQLGLFRAASPVTSSEQHLYLALPSASSGHVRSSSAASLYNDGGGGGIADEKLLIRSFEVLADAIGFKKSFSTSDILGIDTEPSHTQLARSHSDMQLAEAAPLFRLEASSRSLSTWVAVGDTSATTQLPSPQARLGSTSPNFTPADLIRSVNKRIRQTYLRKRLLTTYKALERMSQSGFNLEKLQDVVNEGELASHPELLKYLSSSPSKPNKFGTSLTGQISQLGVTATKPMDSIATNVVPIGNKKQDSVVKKKGGELLLSSKEIDRDRGKPLSKFDRNVMIFDWLHSLDETATIDLA